MTRSSRGVGHIVRPLLDRSLNLGVMELGERANQHAVKAVLALAPVGPDRHAYRECGPVLRPLLSELRSLEMRSGSIGTTRSGK